MSGKPSLGEAVLDLTGDDSKLQKTTKGAKLNVEKILGGLGTGMKALGVGIAATSAAVATLGAGIFAMATKAANGADEIMKMASTYSLTTDKIQELKYAAELVDVPLDTMTGSFSRLNMALGAAKDPTSEQAKLFAQLGVSVLDASGQMRTTNDVWLDTIDALGGVQNQTDRDIISLKLFGRSAADLNPLIAAGSAALAKFGLEAHTTGNVIDTDLLEAAAKLDDALERIKSTAGSVVMKLGAEFAPGIEAFVNVVSGYLTRFSNLIGDESLTTEQKISAGGALIATILVDIRDSLPQLLESGLGIMKSLITGVVQAIPVMIPVLIDAIMGITDFLIEMLPMALDALIKVVVLAFEGIAEALPELLPKLVKLIMDLLITLIQATPLILKAGLEMIVGLVKGLVDSIPVLVEAIPEVIMAIVDATIDMLPEIILAAVEIVMALVFGIVENIPLIVATIPKIIKAMIDKFKSPEFKKQMSDMGKELVEGLKEGWTNAWENFKDMVVKNFKESVQAIKDLLGIASPSTVFAGIGDNLMQGLTIGINRSAQMPVMATTQVAGALSQSSVTNNYNLAANYKYQSESTLIDQVKMLQLLGGH
jgi:hypothetical protein